MARTARRDVIGLLMERQLTYTEVEADALVAKTLFGKLVHFMS